jgi:hypothetical protein
MLPGESVTLLEELHGANKLVRSGHPYQLDGAAILDRQHNGHSVRERVIPVFATTDAAIVHVNSANHLLHVGIRCEEILPYRRIEPALAGNR